MKIRIVPLSRRIWNAQLVFRKSTDCNHTFTACKMGRVSVFSAKQTAWIIYKFGEVKCIKSKSNEEFKSVIEGFSQAMDSKLIRKVCRSARTRFEMLQLEKGGRFEHKQKAFPAGASQIAFWPICRRCV